MDSKETTPQVNYQAPPKNGERASTSKGASTNNTNTIDTSEVLDYISTAMATLSAFEKRLKTQVATNPILSEM